MKSLTILTSILLFAIVHCVIINPIDPAPIDVARRPLVD